jgi:hypothetical protein
MNARRHTFEVTTTTVRSYKAHFHSPFKKQPLQVG